MYSTLHETRNFRNAKFQFLLRKYQISTSFHVFSGRRKFDNSSNFLPPKIREFSIIPHKRISTKFSSFRSRYLVRNFDIFSLNLLKKIWYFRFLSVQNVRKLKRILISVFQRNFRLSVRDISCDILVLSRQVIEENLVFSVSISTKWYKDKAIVSYPFGHKSLCFLIPSYPYYNFLSF